MRRDELQTTVFVVDVVPARKLQHPSPGLHKIREPIDRIKGS